MGYPQPLNGLQVLFVQEVQSSFASSCGSSLLKLCHSCPSSSPSRNPWRRSKRLSIRSRMRPSCPGCTRSSSPRLCHRSCISRLRSWRSTIWNSYLRSMMPFLFRGHSAPCDGHSFGPLLRPPKPFWRNMRNLLSVPVRWAVVRSGLRFGPTLRWSGPA